MPDDLYERDILTWAEHQSELLRRLAAGEGENEAVDWPHVIEELQDVGLSELRACESLLRQALAHLLQLQGWPDGPAVHWRTEAAGLLADAQSRFTPSMRSRISLDTLYRKALKQVRAGEEPKRTLPEACPFTPDELLTEDADVAALASRLQT